MWPVTTLTEFADSLLHAAVNVPVPKAYRRSALSYGLVAIQLGAIVVACWPFGLINRGHLLWLLLCLIGAAFGLWALAHNSIGVSGVFPEPRPGMRLITTGPYELVRHPMYGALIIMMLGIAVYNGHMLNWLAVLVIMPVLTAKALIEERLLQHVFPDYGQYLAATRHRFLPFLL